MPPLQFLMCSIITHKLSCAGGMYVHRRGFCARAMACLEKQKTVRCMVFCSSLDSRLRTLAVPYNRASLHGTSLGSGYAHTVEFGVVLAHNNITAVFDSLT